MLELKGWLFFGMAKVKFHNQCETFKNLFFKELCVTDPWIGNANFSLALNYEQNALLSISLEEEQLSTVRYLDPKPFSE